MSDSDWKDNTSDEDREIIRTIPILTKSGRVSKPIASKKSSKSNSPKSTKTSKTSKKSKMATLSEEQLNTLVSSIQGNTKMNTTLPETSLPSYAGRKKIGDVGFFKEEPFSEFLKQIESMIESYGYTTDAEKINLLANLADKKQGDFHLTMSQIKTHKILKLMNYDQVITYLKTIYATESEMSLADSAAALAEQGNIKLCDRTNLGQYLVEFQGRLENFIKFYRESNPVQLPDRNAADTLAEYEEKVTLYGESCMRELALRLYVGTQMTPSVNRKAFDLEPNAHRDYQDSVVKIHKAVYQTPKAMKCFIGESTKSVGETESYKVDSQSNQKNEECEIYYGNYNNDGRSRNSGRGYRGGQRGYNSARGYRGGQRGNYKGYRNEGQQDRASMKDVRCFKCQKLGHYARDCRSNYNNYRDVTNRTDRTENKR